MALTEQIVDAFRTVQKPMTRVEVMEAIGADDGKQVSALISYLVKQGKLEKAEPTSDGVSQWRHPAATETQGDAPTHQTITASITIPSAAALRDMQAWTQEPPMREVSVASVMVASMEQDTLPQVCVNLGTGVLVISAGDDTIKIDSLAAAQHLHLQMEKAITALGALDGR